MGNTVKENVEPFVQKAEKKLVSLKVLKCGTSLVAQWLTIRLSMTIPTCQEPTLHNKRSHRNEKPLHRNQE